MNAEKYKVKQDKMHPELTGQIEEIATWFSHAFEGVNDFDECADEIKNATFELADQYFPKGEVKERGRALVLVSEILKMFGIVKIDGK